MELTMKTAMFHWMAAAAMCLGSLGWTVEAQSLQQSSSYRWGVSALPFGVEQVLKLSRAGLSEDLILKYIEGASTVYQLEPEHLIYLRDQGVSDRVIAAMLEQRLKPPPNPPAAAPTASAPSAGARAEPDPNCPLHCPCCGRFMYSCVGPWRPLSTLHIIPYTSPVGPASPFRAWGPYRFYASGLVPGCGWTVYPCGHWHGCRPWGY